MILVACEESQAVTIELRRLGYVAFSSDLQECSGGHPEWHICGDVVPLLDGRCKFATMDGVIHYNPLDWDMIIAFPPCTHLAVSGAKHFDKKRADGRQLEGIRLFAQMLNANCRHIAVENPVNIIGSDYIKKWYPEYSYLPNKTQVIQPYEYGHPSRKATCLWLKGLPCLTPTEIVKPDLVTYTCANGKKVTFSKDYGGGGGDNGKRRSKTYHGVAVAMAEQWTKYLKENTQ